MMIETCWDSLQSVCNPHKYEHKNESLGCIYILTLILEPRPKLRAELRVLRSIMRLSDPSPRNQILSECQPRIGF